MTDQGTTKKPIYKKWWFWLGGVIVLIVIASSGNTPSSSNSAQNGSEEQQVEAIVITPTALNAAYEKNEIAADNAYKNKLVKMSGVVENIGTVFGDSYVTLEAGGLLSGVQCTLADDAVARASTLEKGQKVVLQGKVSGKSLGVSVKDCVFVE